MPAGPLLYSDPPRGSDEWHAQRRLWASYAVVFFAHALHAAYGVQVLHSGTRVWTIPSNRPATPDAMDNALRWAGLPDENPDI